MAYDGRVFTANDCMTTQILMDAAEEQQKAADEFYRRLGREVEIFTPDVSLGAYTPAYPSLINVIEGNLSRLCEGGYYDGRMGRPVVWRGELEDSPRLSYEDVNRWFASCGLLKGVAAGAAERAVVTGRSNTGDGRDERQFRRG